MGGMEAAPVSKLNAVGAAPLKVLCAIGTRPEVIKMAPVVHVLRRAPWARVRVLSTGQHRDLLEPLLARLDVAPDRTLGVMRENQSLPALTAALIEGIDRVLGEELPDVVLGQGDTTTVLALALACFYRRVDFGHVEAGLRTFDAANPYPEEMNRVLAGRMARHHYCPTQAAVDNLLREGVATSMIHRTGNTVIDTLLATRERARFEHPALDPSRRLVLVTAHRRENFGAPYERICRAIVEIARRVPDAQFLYPVHPNPNVRDSARRLLGGCPSVILCEPLDYFEFVGAMQRAHLILTDSGGVQEEAPALARPVLVLRAVTERPEAVAAGVVQLVGTEVGAIVQAAQALLTDDRAYRAMARGVSPYGDGRAALRIAEQLRTHYRPQADPLDPDLSHAR